MFESTPITLEEVRSSAKKMHDDGWRLVTHTVIDRGDEGFDILFHYDKDLVEKHFRLKVARGTVIPSTSHIYFAALLVENENRDLFGPEYVGLILNFNRTLSLEETGDSITRHPKQIDPDG